MTLDPRLHAYHDDLADIALRGKVEALRFVKPELRQMTVSIASVHAEPRMDAATVTEALLGEQVNVFQIKDGWAFVQLVADRYVGYLPARCLTSQVLETTHRIAVPSTLLYVRPDIKATPVQHVYMNSLVSVIKIEGDFARLRDHRFVWLKHLMPAGTTWDDPATIAEAFVNAPYLWGGKSAAGLDCSALVQLAWQACGFDCPRDTDMIQSAFGKPLQRDRNLKLARNDMVFWKGHVGLMLDSSSLIHANGYHMQVVVEPLSSAIGRIASLYGQVTGVSRVPEMHKPGSPGEAPVPKGRHY